jgi:hypothetical protein
MRAAAISCGVFRDALCRSKPTCSYSARWRNMNSLRNRASSRAQVAPRTRDATRSEWSAASTCANGTAGRMSDQMHPVETQVIDEPQRVRGPLLYFVGRLALARAHPAMIEGHDLEERRRPVPSSRCRVRQGPPRTRWVDLRRKRHRRAFGHRSRLSALSRCQKLAGVEGRILPAGRGSGDPLVKIAAPWTPRIHVYTRTA